MPRLAQILIRSALIWLGLGYTAGGLALAAKGLPALGWLWPLRASHVHLLLVGWTVQLALGVAYWVLPRLDAAGNRGGAWPVWLSYVALNLGVALAALHPLLGAAGARWMPALAGALYIAAIAAFAAHAWRRVLPFRAHPRPQRQRGG